MKIKQMIALMLTAALLLLCLPVSAMAAENKWIKWNLGTMYTESITKEEFGGKWTLDIENSTLTLENISYTVNDTNLYLNGISKIVLVGENTIVSNVGSGIACYNAPLTITGTGSLNVAGGQFAILTVGRNLTIDGVKVSASEVQGRDYPTIQAQYSTVAVTNGAEVTVKNCAGSYKGAIMAYNGKVLVENGSSLNVVINAQNPENPPLGTDTGLEIRDTSTVSFSVHNASGNPFRYTGKTDARTQKMTFDFPDEMNGEITSDAVESECGYQFNVDVAKHASEADVYVMSIKGKQLPESELSHIWDTEGWKSNGDDTHTLRCLENSAHNLTENCVGGKATTTKKAVCDVCGSEYGVLIPKTGDSSNLVLWFGMLAASAIAMMFLGRRAKKEY